MKYDFETRPDRSGTGALKWYFAPKDAIEKGAVPLSTADMELPTAPEIIEAMVKAAEHGVIGYTWADNAYRDAVLHWFSTRHNAQFQREDIVLTPGVVSALNVAVRAFTQPGEKVIIQTPVYHRFFDAVTNNGRELVECPLVCNNGVYEMDYDEMERLLKDPAVKLFLLCSPHNPVGRVWKREELLRIGKLCNENGVIVVADEIHGDLIFPPHQQVVYATLGEEYANNCVVCTAVSKTFNLAGLGCSNIFIPNPQLREKFSAQVTVEGYHNPPYFAYGATLAAYYKGAAWLDALLEHVKGNADWAVQYFKEHLPQASIPELEGTYLLWVDLRFLGLRGKEFASFLQDEAVVVLDKGKGFGAIADGCARINLAAPRADIVTAVENICRAANARL